MPADFTCVEFVGGIEHNYEVVVGWSQATRYPGCRSASGLGPDCDGRTKCTHKHRDQCSRAAQDYGGLERRNFWVFL